MHRARHRDRSQEPLDDLLGQHSLHAIGWWALQEHRRGLHLDKDRQGRARCSTARPITSTCRLHIRIDPNDSNHLYAGDGVRGSSHGFFVSTDGGDNFVKPQGFIDALKTQHQSDQDIYDVAADPTDFKHLLISFHSAWGWTDTKWNTDAGVLESKDGGTTWIVTSRAPGWGAGHAVKFLYNPALGIGNSQTWLLGTQGDGFWRTTDSGATWTKVSDNNITHGGGTIYYAQQQAFSTRAAGRCAAPTTAPRGHRSAPTARGACTATARRSTRANRSAANQPFSVSPETDGVTWTPFNTQKFPDGPYEMAYDAVNGIMYSSNWSSGVWALKVGPGDPDAGTGTGAGHGGSSTGGGGSAGAGGGVGSGGTTGAGGTRAFGCWRSWRDTGSRCRRDGDRWRAAAASAGLVAPLRSARVAAGTAIRRAIRRRFAD